MGALTESSMISREGERVKICFRSERTNWTAFYSAAISFLSFC